MSMPLFSFFGYPDHPELYNALRAAGPADAWRPMSELRRLDEGLEVQNVDPQESRGASLELGRAGTDLAPALDDGVVIHSETLLVHA